MTNELAGLGGSVKYFRTRAGGAYYYPFTDEIIGAITGEAGFIVGLGDDVSITDRFFLGGDNLRGFEDAGAGPRDKQTDDALGGNNIITGTAQCSRSACPPNSASAGAVFSDAGTLWDLDNDECRIDDDAIAAPIGGFGVTWKSPFGPFGSTWPKH